MKQPGFNHWRSTSWIGRILAITALAVIALVATAFIRQSGAVLATDAAVPTVSSITVTSDAGDDDTYDVGDKIEITVTFSEDVTVSGTPQIKLKVGEITRIVSASLSYNDVIIFPYTVVVGDVDNDGVSVDANSLSLNEGTIRDEEGNNADLSHNWATTGSSSHKVLTVPIVSSVAITSDAGGDNAYDVGDTIEVTVTFSEDVTANGTPQIKLKVGEITRVAPAKIRYGNIIKFGYTVVAGDTDNDGVSVDANSLTTETYIQDDDGNDADLSHEATTGSSSHKVLTVPIVSSVAITSDAGGDNAYDVGDTIEITVTFSEDVTVSGTPQIKLKVGEITRIVSASLSYNDVIIFPYTVVVGDVDNDGVSVDANSLTTETYIQDDDGNDADLSHEATTGSSSHKVLTVPAVLSVEVTSDAGDDDTYIVGDTIEITVTFSEDIDVNGTPKLNIKIGDKTRAASYSSTNGAAVSFTYTVVEGDVDTDGVSVEANSLTSGVYIQNDDDDDANLSHKATTSSAKHKVDAPVTIPTITSIDFVSDPGSDNVYVAGDKIDIRITFSENIIVIGIPQLKLEVGNETKTITSSTRPRDRNFITYHYTVAEGDLDADGVGVGANSLSLNGGNFRDKYGNNADVSHAWSFSDGAHGVGESLITPSISSVAITSDAVSDNTYGAGDKIKVTITFNENVTVSGSPQFKLKVGETTKTVTASTRSQNLITFIYTVVVGDTDSDGVSVAANSIDLNGGTIQDEDGNNADLDHTAISDSSSHKVLAPGGV